jgi:antitoxin (DNA-binding transcriptional repressor) of toxin-antitoxin stability system
MRIFGIRDAWKNLSGLIRESCAGEEVVIARDKIPVIRLVPSEDGKGRKGLRKLGILKGKLVVGPEFFGPLPEDELARWE